MYQRTSKHSLWILGFVLAPLLVVGDSQAGEPAAKVVLNGKAVPVFFNDGDSFRVLKGSKKGAKARLAGYNTLESHGAVHQWGTWTTKELYHVAKIATLYGRQGSWTCETDGATDTYGRMLVHCPELAENMVRRGYAHALSIDDTPSDAKLLAAQKEAIDAKRGIWAHGIPEFVLTSLHSVEEDVEGHGTYNRLVSSKDGHSIKWKHSNEYQECENVCLTVYPQEAGLLDAVITRLQAESPALVEGLSAEQVREVVAGFQRIRLVDKPAPVAHRESLNKLLRSYAKEGLFGTAAGSEGSCMIHVPFTRRFGGNRAACLKK